MKLIVGLGNPGIEYQFTPHNAGFLAIDRIAEDCGVVVANRRSRALTAKARLAGQEVLLAKPETFMNLSGMAVAALVRELELDAKQDVIVLYDDIALPLGTIRIRERGSAGGHNGVKSISGALASEDWLRIRIGIAPSLPEAAGSLSGGRQREYVLSPFRKADLVVLDEVLDRVELAVEAVLTRGVSTAMNEFNRKGPNASEEPNGSKGPGAKAEG